MTFRLRAFGTATQIPASLPVAGRQNNGVGQFVVRLDNERLVVWSDTVDAPTSPAMTGAALIDHLEVQHGLSEEDSTALVRAAVEFGTSDPTRCLEVVLRTNRAGPDERTLTLAELLRGYG